MKQITRTRKRALKQNKQNNLNGRRERKLESKRVEGYKNSIQNKARTWENLITIKQQAIKKKIKHENKTRKLTEVNNR